MRRSGFTLIELLVVIAIIAILAAILFPVFARARAKAMQNTCLSNVKEISLSLLMYASDFDNYLPNCKYCSSYATYPSWWDCVYPYIKNEQIAFCPMDNGDNGAYNPAPNYGTCTACNPQTTARPSYCINGNIAGEYSFAQLTMVNNPAETILVDPIDSGFGQNPREMGWQDYAYAIPNLQAGVCDAVSRHNGGENWGLVDGHAKFYPAPTLTTVIYLGACAAGTSLPAAYQAGFDWNCN
jgi:prepilin-type N-terminal cleavage/methylation domain-containing protein